MTNNQSCTFVQALRLLVVYLLSAVFHLGPALAGPIVDTTFGSQAYVRVGEPTGQGTNSPGITRDRIDVVRVDSAGRVLVAGLSGGSGTTDFVVSRLETNGTLDAGYGSGGRLYPHKSPHFTGVLRVGLQSDGALVAATGAAAGSAGGTPSVAVFRATPLGQLDATFQPNLLPAGANSAVGLAVRADGRVLYGTFAQGSMVLQQVLPDGMPDPAFGTGGQINLPTNLVGSGIYADLALLPDGSAIFGTFTNDSIRLYKIDAAGRSVASFGAGGVAVVPAATPGAHLQFQYDVGPTLLALPNGTILAAQRSSSLPAEYGTVPHESLFVARLSSDGQVLGTGNLLGADTYLSWALVGLPDSSVMIARSIISPSSATLHRLLPDGQFDASLGPNGAFALAGFALVRNLAVDAAGRMLVVGEDAVSALVARFRLDAPVTSVAATEYFNVNLGHYFVTAGPGERALIEAGGAGPGWQRTGNDFRAWLPETGVPVGAVPVCRFYGTPGRGPNAHFYTMSAAECAAVKLDAGWTYEGTAFYVTPPLNDRCPGSIPIYRAYNNGFVRNDSNHRYSTQLPVLQAMTAQGWTVEGVAFCGAAG